ncbi:MAG: PAS domain-containing protein [Gammaproteobacteria bacterium]|nr:PAS domain-containing protein [Gammaproteobacteria bacterium]
MIKLPSQNRSVLAMVLLSLLVVVFVSAWQYWQFRSGIKRLGSEQLAVLTHIPYQVSASSGEIERLFQSVIKSGPMPEASYIQLIDSAGLTVADYASGQLSPAGLTAEGGQLDGYQEFSAYVKHESMMGSVVRLVIASGWMDFLKSKAVGIVLGSMPAILIIWLMSFFSGRRELPLKQSFDVMQRLFSVIPHAESEVRNEVSESANLDNLTLLARSAEEYIATFESERSVFNTSTKVLAYQKAGSESILRSVPDGILVLDETGQVIFANQQFLRWYRLTEDSVVGKMPIDWCDRPELLGFLRRYSGMLARRAESGNIEMNPPGKPGASLSLTAFPMFSVRNEEQINNTLIVLSDITTEVMAQKARDEFAAALAHELKTPLHAIGMHAELLLGDEGEDSNIRVESANYINTEVEHISELVRNMLNITRIETGSLQINRKLTKINDLLNSAIDNLATTASENQITLHKDYPETMEPCYLDKDLLRVAINNLLSNAIKYNRTGGEVTVSYSENENNLILSVSDTGFGISEAEKSHIFEKFYRSDDIEVRERSGHGLGLSLVKEIIDLHNGSISVDSVKGEGTRFTVRLKRINVPLKEAA